MRSTLAGRQRSVPLAFALVIAVIAGVFAFTTQRGEAHAGVLGHDHTVGPVGLPTAAEVTFHDQMRKLWEDHVTWTRRAIVEFADGSAGFDATATRLLQNQTDIGNAIAPFYGAAAGQELSTLLARGDSRGDRPAAHDPATTSVRGDHAQQRGDRCPGRAAQHHPQRPL